jgi:L-threonylcarbamoyladenylate synthase
MITNSIEAAAEALNRGDVVAIPTETVYGLAASVQNPDALKKIFAVKERPLFDPLIVHVDGIAMAQRYTNQWTPAAEVLAQKFWPGPLTLILPKSDQIHSLITSGLDSVGIRVPKHALTLELIAKVGHGLAAPSANKFGKTSPTRSEHVQKEFIKDEVLILEGGPSRIGVESTVLKIEGLLHFKVSVLRAGDIGRDAISKCLTDAGIDFEWHQFEKKYSPGHMKHHYMPDIPLVLVDEIAKDEDVLHLAQTKFKVLPEEIEGVKLRKPTQLKSLVYLQLSSDPKLGARELYEQLRVCAGAGKDLIAFRWPKDFDLASWEAVSDRLVKAASLDLRGM